MLKMTLDSIKMIPRLLQRMSLREQLLILLFSLTMLTLWAGSLLNRAESWNTGREQSRIDLEAQQLLIDRETTYSEGLAAALKRVEPGKTFSAAQLSGRIDEILRKAQLSGASDIDPVRSRSGEIFNDHNIRVRLSRISIAQIITLNKLLRQETPYINIQKVSLTANRNKPTQIDARYEINSFELIKQK